MNNVILIGRLTSGIEVNYTKSQMAVAGFNLAIDRPVKQGEEKKTDFPRCKVFGKQAENMEKFTGKGKLVAVQGTLQTGSYQNKNGDMVYTTDVMVNRVQFLEWGDKTENKPRINQEQAYTVEEEIPDNFQAIDEDIPF